MGKRKCSGCGERFDRELDGSINFGVLFFHENKCRIEYGIKSSRKLAEKAAENRIKERRKSDRIKKESLKTAGEYIKEAQAAVNKYIRMRDWGEPCISCGTPHKIKYGGYVDAGHYRSRGSASHLRFNLLNIHGQCVKCNRFNSGNAVDYRINLIDKIGIDNVNKLECDNKPRKFTIEYLNRVKKIFNKRARFYESRKKAQ